MKFMKATLENMDTNTKIGLGITGAYTVMAVGMVIYGKLGLKKIEEKEQAEEITIIYADDEDWVITKTKETSVRKVVRDISTGRYHK